MEYTRVVAAEIQNNHLGMYKQHYGESLIINHTSDFYHGSGMFVSAGLHILLQCGDQLFQVETVGQRL